MKEKKASSWSLYIIRTRGGQLYTGITTDLNRRLAQHEAGTGAKNLRGKGPFQLEFSEQVGDRSVASRLEAAVKKLSRQQKEALICGDIDLPILNG